MSDLDLFFIYSSTIIRNSSTKAMDLSHETPEQIAQHVLVLAEAGSSMEALLCFQQWIFVLQQDAPSNTAWVLLTPVLQACMWLKQNGGVLGLAIILRTEVIPLGLRHLILHADSSTSTTVNSESRSQFFVDSSTLVNGFRLGCHDYYEADKNEYYEIKAMAHKDWIHDFLSWHIEVRPDGSLVFRNSNPAWKELVLRGPVRNHYVSGQNVVLAAMPLDLDTVHTWELCVAVDRARQNDPDSIKNQFMLKCVGATTDCFLEAAFTDEGKRDSGSFYLSFQEHDRSNLCDLPCWCIQQAGFDDNRVNAQEMTRRLLNCSTFNSELIQESLEMLQSGFYDIVEHAELTAAISRMFTMGAITATKLESANELLLAAIRLHKFHLDTCLDPIAHQDSAAFKKLVQKRQKIDETIKILRGKTNSTDDKIDTID